MQERQPVDVLSVLQFVLSGLAALALLGSAVTLALTSVISIGRDAGSITPMFMVTVSAGMLGLLLLPSAVTALAKMIGKPFQPRAFLRRPLPVIAFTPLLWVLVLAGGNWISGNANIEGFFLPVMHLLAVGLPILWFLALVLRDLPSGSPQRRWGSFATGAAGVTTLAILAEILLVFVLVVILIVFVASRPDVMAEIERLAQRMTNLQTNPDAMLRVLAPWVQKPLVAGAALLFMAGMVPFIEELLKPLAVLLLCRRHLTPTDGFVVGLLCGAGFAMAESLGASSSLSGDQWLPIVAARSGTALMHMLTAGLTGWALTATWLDGKWLRAAGAYLLAVLFHAVWNTISLLMGVKTLLSFSPDTAKWVLGASNLAPYGLALLMAVMLAVLLRLSAHLKRESSPQTPAS